MRYKAYNRQQAIENQDSVPPVSYTHLPQTIAPASQFILSMAVASAIRTALAHYVHADCLQIKWPNDIYWKDKKIAGILIENDLTRQRRRSRLRRSKKEFGKPQLRAVGLQGYLLRKKKNYSGK